MHVHVPKPLHGWKEFANEIFVIIVGVLIALGLEQAVEAYHWHEKGELAQQAMRIEMLDDNAPQIYIRMLIYPCLEQSSTALLEQSETLGTERLQQLIAQTRAPYNTFDSEAWKAVQSSDLANHVDPERLIAWSLPYRLMPAMSDMTIQEHTLQAELRAVLRTSAPASTDELARLRSLASQLRTLNNTIATVSLVAMQRLRKQGIILPDAKLRALEQETRDQYGTCVARPDFTRHVDLPNVHNDAINRLALDRLYKTEK